MPNTPAPLLSTHLRIALVGRTNVGKSTLFNRLLGSRRAVVAPTPGTTRDRLLGTVTWRGRSFTVMDTAGFDLTARHGLQKMVQDHVHRALREADVFLLLCDAQQGLVPMDLVIMESLRKTGKPVFVAANKADHRLVVPPDCYAFGVDSVVPISALHGRGIGELLGAIVGRVPLHGSARVESTAPAVAIVGRQNVGKSSLLNALLREDRVIVSDQPGTTRDAIDTSLTVRGQPVTLIDTAGLRHRRKVTSVVDLFSMARTLDAIARCDAALVLLDATQGVTRDDQRIINKVIESGCGIVILANKWDLVAAQKPRPSEAGLAQALKRLLPFTACAPVLAVSAKTGFQVARALAKALQIAQARRAGLSDTEVSSILQIAWKRTPPPRERGRLIRLQQARWIAGRPIRVVITTAPKAVLPPGYQRYLLNQLATHPRCAGLPVQLSINER